MALKSLVKRIILGKSGQRPRSIRVGLLRGLRFNVDSGCKGMRLVALDEREIASATRRFAQRARFALDIGANDGWYTTYFASLPNIAGVIGFEPGDGLDDALRANLRLNDSIPPAKVEIIRKFASDRDDEQNLTVDSLRPRLQSPLLIKLDVDGGETAVLKGCHATLREFDCLLVVETHSPELERDCISLLEEAGYEATIIDKGWYRAILPEGRVSQHNRWFVASKKRA